MNKEMKDLLKLLAHVKSAGFHLQRCEQLASDRYEHDLAAQFQTAYAGLRAQVSKAQHAYGYAAMKAVRRAR